MTEPDLTPFRKANARTKRVKWEDRRSLVEEHFPSVTDPDIGHKMMQDDRVLGALLRDILHSAQSTPGKLGRKKVFDPERGREDLRTLQGQNYTHLPFHEAFRKLATDKSGREQSLTEISRKTAISRSKVHRLLKRVEPPSVEDLTAIAQGYGKPPSFFGEYRSRFVAQHLAAVLEDNPEMSQAVYQKIAGGFE